MKANTTYALIDNDGKVLGAFKTPTTGNLTLVLSAPSLSAVKYGVSVNGGTSLLNDVYTQDATVSGGSGCTLSSYTGGGGGRW